MKLKEKLAEEYEKGMNPFTHPVYQAYLAGFETARDMAIELVHKPAWICVRDMPNLGEEEV